MDDVLLYPGYAGVNCEEDIDACVTDGGAPKCRNGATCIDSIVGLEYNCVCLPGYTGKLFYTIEAEQM